LLDKISLFPKPLKLSLVFQGKEITSFLLNVNIFKNAAFPLSYASRSRSGFSSCMISIYFGLAQGLWNDTCYM
jgi:hypothetical protein